MTFFMTLSTLSCTTRSARLSSRVTCRLTIAIRPPDFLVKTGRLAHGKICSDVPRHMHRSACLVITSSSSSITDLFGVSKVNVTACLRDWFTKKFPSNLRLILKLWVAILNVLSDYRILTFYCRRLNYVIYCVFAETFLSGPKSLCWNAATLIILIQCKIIKCC